MTTVSAIVTVAAPVRHLPDALRSIASQHHAALETVVVADGVAVPAVAAGTRVIALDGGGVAAARNAGVRAARGELVALLDHDDVWSQDKLARQVALLAGGADVATGRLQAFLEPGREAPAWLPPGMLDGPRRNAQVGTWLVRRSAFQTIGGFDPAREPADDLDWLLRARHAGLTVVEHNDVVMRYRIHGDNRSADTALVRAATLGAVRAAIHRGTR